MKKNKLYRFDPKDESDSPEGLESVEEQIIESLEEAGEDDDVNPEDEEN